MPTKTTPKRKDREAMTELDLEIQVMELESQLNLQKNSLLQADIQIKKAEREVARFRKTKEDLQTAIADTEDALLYYKGGE